MHFGLDEREACKMNSLSPDMHSSQDKPIFSHDPYLCLAWYRWMLEMHNPVEDETCKPTMHFPSTMQTLIWMPVLHTASWARP
jgi:hypothetical protein